MVIALELCLGYGGDYSISIPKPDLHNTSPHVIVPVAVCNKGRRTLSTEHGEENGDTTAHKIEKSIQENSGEFDPGSGRTLAACLTHASRTGIWWKLAEAGC